jgi:hypothetical protein
MVISFFVILWGCGLSVSEKRAQFYGEFEIIV